MAHPLSIAIAGGGIGGLTAALALARKGMDVQIFEKSSRFNPVGAGLQLSANALCVLDQLQVTGLRDAGLEIDHVRIRDGLSGKDLAQIPTPADPKTVVLSRSSLHECLWQAVQACPNILTVMDAALVDAQDNGTSVSLTTQSGTTASADVLIGADGVWSQTRASVSGTQPAYSGRMAWRAALPMDQVPSGIARDTVTLWLAPKAHLVTYPIDHGTSLNAVAFTQGDWNEQGWSAPGNRDEFSASFSPWTSVVQELIDIPDQWLKWALCGVSPTHNWTKGRIALLGDAAHAMVPFMAQGAAMSIEDGAILAQMLDCATPETVPAQLKTYEILRKSRVQRVWDQSFQQGRIYHMGGVMRLARNTAMRFGGDALGKRYNWIYDWRARSQQ
ncbi:MAG: monooxygenase [Hyphomicrobiales bacterium]|nr:MAG: monooxygenase [Hyphomicrobiales bacterium]